MPSGMVLRKSGRAARSRGFSLVEVAVGVLIMAIVIFPSLNVIMNETKAVSGTREHSQAAFVAHRVIETARTYNFDRLQQEFQANYAGQTFKINDIDFTIGDFALEEVKSSDPANVVLAKKIAFSVTYKTREGKEHKLEIATLVSRHD